MYMTIGPLNLILFLLAPLFFLRDRVRAKSVHFLIGVMCSVVSFASVWIVAIATMPRR